jgi:hypothetical protein
VQESWRKKMKTCRQCRAFTSMLAPLDARL